MRRRLFWTIAGVAGVTGLLVLAAAVFASQRAAVDATYRELQVSANEAVTIIQEFVEDESRAPTAAIELLRLVTNDELATLFGRIRRTAGGSDIGVALITEEGNLQSDADIFRRIDLEGEVVTAGETHRTTSETGELVVVIPTVVDVNGTDITLLVALARAAPIVRLSDQIPGVLLLTAGIVVMATLGARLLSTQLADRLEPLAEASRRVAAGDMKARVPEVGDPDLDQVGGAFNEMASELEAALRRQGYNGVAAVEEATLEPEGVIAVTPKPPGAARSPSSARPAARAAARGSEGTRRIDAIPHARAGCSGQSKPSGTLALATRRAVSILCRRAHSCLTSRVGFPYNRFFSWPRSLPMLYISYSSPDPSRPK